MFKASDLFVAALENEGVDRIFGIPGEANLDIVESIRKSSIQLILTRHEQAAAFMAATYGRLTGKPGVCITTLGPGALNLSTGAALLTANSLCGPFQCSRNCSGVSPGFRYSMRNTLTILVLLDGAPHRQTKPRPVAVKLTMC